MHRSPTVAIVGRPNVGKSTLFNRLIGKRYAITSEIAGTTRDRVSQWWDCNGYKVLLVDTGGLANDAKDDIEEDVQSQAKTAIESADLIIFVTNIAQSLTADDFTAADILRKSQKPVILVANKCDNPNLEEHVYNIYELGFGEPIAISAIHETGVEKLTSVTEKFLKDLKFNKEDSQKKKDKKFINLCILGKPNTGKSSLVNALLGENKHIVSNVPGTTRDTLDTEITFDNQKYNLIDTAGLRRRGKIEKGIEKFGALRVINAIERSDIVLLVMDGNERISKQDCHIVQEALEREKGLILIINKIDIFDDKEKKENHIISVLRQRFDFVPWAPVLFISAKTKENITEIFNLSNQIIIERSHRIPTPELNTFLQKITYKHTPASHSVRKPKFLYATQADAIPPTFILFFRNAKNLHFSYARYLENEIRKKYGFAGTAVRLKFKENSAKELKK
jgi:GTP-binding protein